jgi:hypothetical protein
MPFQIDDRDTAGRWILRNSHTLTAESVLLFMASDVGEKAVLCGSVKNSGSGVEIEVENPGSRGKGWVYLLSFSSSPPRSDRRYVEYDPCTDTVSTPEYRISFGGSFPHFFSLGREGENLLDQLKSRVEARFLWGLITFRLTEEDIRIRLVDYKEGAIRVIRRTEHSAHIGLGIQTPTVTTDDSFYVSWADIPLHINLPFSPRFLFGDIIVRVGPDFRDLRGSLFLSSGGNSPFPIDGVMSAEEAALVGKEVEWVAVTGPQGAFFYRLLVGDTLATLRRTLYYVDDTTAADPPESYPGQGPGLGYFLTGWEQVNRGHHTMQLLL